MQQLQSVCTFTEISNSKADTDNHGELINKPKGNIPGYEKINKKEKGISFLSDDEDDDSRMSGMESDEDDDMEVELESEELDDCDDDDEEDSAEEEANNDNV